MAEEKVIKLNVETSAAAQALKKFGGTLEDVYEEGVQPLNFAIGELEDRLYEMAAAGESGTPKFAAMAKEVGRMKKVILDTDLAVDGFAEGIGVNLGGAIQGISGGFTLAQGVMGAFGANSAALEETLLKVQSAMAITDGIQSVREGIKSFKALKVAAMSNVVVQKILNVVMSMNPIGLIIAGVVALGAAIYALWTPIKKLLQFFGLMEEEAESAAEGSERLAKAYDKANKALEKFRKQAARNHSHTMDMLKLEQDERLRSLERDGAGTEEINKEKRKQIQETHDLMMKNMEEEQKMRNTDIKRTSSYVDKQKKLYRKALREESYDDAKAIRERIEAEREKLATLRFERDNYHKDIEKAEGEHNGRVNDLADEQTADDQAKLKERLDNWKEFLQNKLEAAKRIEDLQDDLIEDKDKQRLEKRRREFGRELEDAKANTRDKEQLLQTENLLTEQYNRDRADIIKEIETKTQEEMLPIRDIGAESHIETEIQKTLASEKYAEQRANAERKMLDIDAEVMNAKLQMTSDVFGAINDLVQAFAKDDEKSARRAFNINKGVGIAQAVISTAQGIINAYANPVDVASGVAFAKSGIIAATGAAQIATIAKTKFQGGGGSGGGSAGSVGSVPSASAAQPTFNVVGNTGINQLAQSLGQQGQQPIQTYVVAGNVTSAQSLERNKIQNASL
jgi:hypothetical protein